MPAPIQTITLDNTFDEQRKVLNQLVVSVNDTDSASNLINVVSNTSTLSVSSSVAKRGVLYIDTNLTATFTNTSLNVIASAASVNVVHFAVHQSEANSRNVAGMFANSANGYTNAMSYNTGIGANAYAQGVRDLTLAAVAGSMDYTNTKIAAIDIRAVAITKNATPSNNYMTGGISIPSVGVGTGLTIRRQDNASEGGEFHLEKPVNTLLYGNVVIDINTNSIRIFENGGSYKGLTANIAGASGGATSEIVHSTNINQYSAKNITDFPLDQSVSTAAMPTFPNINTTGWFQKQGGAGGGFYDVQNQTGLMSVDGGYLRTNHPSAPWYNSNKQVGMVVEGDLWFNSGFGSNSGKAYGCRAWGSYVNGYTTTNTQAVTWWWHTAPAAAYPSKTGIFQLNTTTCDAMGITAAGTNVTLDRALYNNYQLYGASYPMVNSGTYTAYKIGTNTFQITFPDLSLTPRWTSAWSGTDNVTVSISYYNAGVTQGSGGVSSIVDNGGGQFTVNFSTAMPDANYAIIAKYLREANAEYLHAPYSVKNQYGFNLFVSPTSNQWPFYFAIFR